MGFQVLILVMPGLDPGIHQSSRDSSEEMDCRIKSGNDALIDMGHHGNARSNRPLTSSGPRSTAPYMLA
jgi:hypothetical protein